MSSSEDHIKKNNQAPVPPNVQRLGKLLEGGFDQNVSEIVKIIQSDEVLTKKTLAMATGGRKRDVEMEIDTAVVRLGVSSITLLVMTELLDHAVTRTFATMLNAELRPVSFDVDLRGQMLGCITITGRVGGKVYLRVPDTMAGWLVNRFLGEGAVPDPSEVFADVVGELLNMIGGNFKSNLCDAGLPCSLSVPAVELQNGFQPELGDDQQIREMVYTVEEMPVILTVIMNRISK